jgi:serine protease
VLHAAAGGSADDLHQTYAITAAELTGDRNGTYTLTIVDGAAQDTGTLDGWKVAF